MSASVGQPHEATSIVRMSGLGRSARLAGKAFLVAVACFCVVWGRRAVLVSFKSRPLVLRSGRAFYEAERAPRPIIGFAGGATARTELPMPRIERDLPMLLRPAGAARPRTVAAAVIPLLVASAALVVLGAWAMPDGYSWLALSISESAAQAQEHGWVARMSFLCFGLAVLLLAIAMRARWPRLTYGCHLVFAASMFGAAAFSHSPWQAGAPNDPVEDLLHSVFASGMGFAFCAGVVARFLQRGPGAVLGRAFDVVALLAATALPLLLATASGIGGLMQRVMFGVAYLWYAREALISLDWIDERARGSASA